MLDALKKALCNCPKSFEEITAQLSGSDEEKCEAVFNYSKELLTSENEESILTAERLLHFATENCFNVEDTHYKALVFFRLGELYEKHYEDFEVAYEYYKSYELFNTRFGGVHSLLLRIILLKDSFAYTEELENELKLSYGEIDLGLRSDRLFENIGSLIVARNEGEKDELCEEYIKRIKNIVKADELFFPDFIFKKDTVRDVLELPQCVFDFVSAL